MSSIFYVSKSVPVNILQSRVCFCRALYDITEGVEKYTNLGERADESLKMTKECTKGARGQTYRWVVYLYILDLSKAFERLVVVWHGYVHDIQASPVPSTSMTPRLLTFYIRKSAPVETPELCLHSWLTICVVLLALALTAVMEMKELLRRNPADKQAHVHIALPLLDTYTDPAFSVGIFIFVRGKVERFLKEEPARQRPFGVQLQEVRPHPSAFATQLFRTHPYITPLPLCP